MNNICHTAKPTPYADSHSFLITDLRRCGFFGDSEWDFGDDKDNKLASEYMSEVLCANELPLIQHADGNFYCLFHLPTFEKDVEQFKKCFDERFALITTDKTYSTGFDFRSVWFPYELDFSGFTFTHEVCFNSAVFKEDVNFNNCIFEGETSFNYGKFEKTFSSMNSRFDGITVFANVKSVGNVNVENSVFEDMFYFSGIFAEAKVIFENCIFKDFANFTYTEFNDTANFAKAQFYRSAFEGSTFHKTTTFAGAIFHNEQIPGLKSLERKNRYSSLDFGCGFKNKVDFETTVFDVEKIEADNTKFRFQEDVPKVITEIGVHNNNFIRNENTESDYSVEFLDITPLFKKLELPDLKDMIAAADKLLSLKDPRVDSILNDWASENITLADDPNFRITDDLDVYYGFNRDPVESKDIRQTASHILDKLQR